MGKSLILDKLVYDSNSEFFCLKIILNNFPGILKKLNKSPEILNDLKMKKENTFDFILRRVLEKQNDLEISLLKHLVQKQKLILMFDGVDEVVDYREQVKLLIKLLRESGQFEKILITTRNHLKKELEDYFKTISFSLNNIDADDQINFLRNYWYNKNNNRANDLIYLQHSAKKLVDNLRSSLNAKMSELIGIPLQTKMIGDIYFDKLDSEKDFAKFELNNMADLYQKFIEKMIEIQFEEKNKIVIARDQDLFEERRKNCYDDHIRLSSIVLFNQTESDIPCMKESDTKRIVKYGLVVQFRNKIPIFLHQSYAEYFLAEKTIEKLTKNENDQEINQILQNEEFFLVRKFLNDLFPKIELTSINKTGETFLKEICNCCKENLLKILNYLIVSKKANIKSDNQFLIQATTNGHKEIVQLLIEKGININQTETYFGRNALHLASEYGHLEIVQLLIEKGIDIHQKDFQGRNALHWASEKGHSGIVQLLIGKGIDINQTDNNGRNVFHIATDRGHKEIFQLLIDKRIDINQTNQNGENALHWALNNDHKEIVQILIEKGIDINQTNKDGINALHLASNGGNVEIVQLLIEKGIDINKKDNYGDNALHSATLMEHIKVVQLLIEKGIEINQTNTSGVNALHLASSKGHKAIAELLIEKGIDINQTNKYGRNALHFGSQRGNKEIVELLIEKGIDINQTELHGLNALHLASDYGHKEILELLIEKGININQIDNKGQNALNLASFRGHKAIVQFLIEKGIDINQTNNNGYNALHIASEKGLIEIVQLLIEKGIDINKTDKEGNNALNLASKKGHTNIVELLSKRKNFP